MVLNSKYKYYYLLLFIPVVVFLIFIHFNTLNYTILRLVNYVAISSSLLFSIELRSHEGDSNTYEYLTNMKSENYVMMYRTISIFWISGTLTIFTSLAVNLAYLKDVYIGQQIIYLIFILFSTFFYLYFLQYFLINIQNRLFRNSVIISVTLISSLSLMTRSLTTYLMYVTIIGLFLAVTCMNRRLSQQLKREKANKIN